MTKTKPIEVFTGSFMSSFKLNDVEWEMLYELPIISREIYFLIRRHMDFATGITGIKRKLSIACVVDFLACEVKTSRKPEKFSRGKLRNDIEILEKAGLIKRIGEMVFECLLADTDKSNQSEDSRNTATNIATNLAKKSDNKLLKNKDKENGTQPGTQPTIFSELRRSPVSGKDINNLYTSPSAEIAQAESKEEPPAEQVPQTEKKVEFRKIAKQVIDYLNQKLGTHYKYVASNLNLIICRLKEGFSLEEAKLVIDDRISRWGKDSKMQEYLRPKTLFAASNFENYLGGLNRNLAANDDGLPTAEEAYLAYSIYQYTNPNSFTAEVISWISGFRNMEPAAARETFVRVYNQRKPIWIARRQETQNRRG
jgi:uncharacterized phage protein (TIGR02220 family)